MESEKTKSHSKLYAPSDPEELRESFQVTIQDLHEEIAQRDEKIRTLNRLIACYDKAHAHEKRELWEKLRDKYVCATVTGELASQSLESGFYESHEQFAKHCFERANALIAERERRENDGNQSNNSTSERNIRPDKYDSGTVESSNGEEKPSTSGTESP